MKASPVILISTSNEQRGFEFRDRSASLSHCYTRAILRVGGTPLLAPVVQKKKAVAEMVTRADGVMLTGGDDLHPDLYDIDLPKKIAAKAVGIDPQRDMFDFLLIEATLQQRKPLLAICRGPQVLNVALGGGLVTDIPAERPKAMKHHRNKEAHKLVHTMQLVKGTLIRKIYGRDSVRINSAHHQAVGELAPMLRASAWTSDNIIEAIELTADEVKNAPFLVGVQYHPERLVEKHAEHRKLFRAFVNACRA